MVYVVRSLSHVRLFAASWTVACQAPLPRGFSRQKYWSAFSCHPNPGMGPTSLMSPPLVGGLFTTRATWEAPCF